MRTENIIPEVLKSSNSFSISNVKFEISENSLGDFPAIPFINKILSGSTLISDEYLVNKAHNAKWISNGKILLAAITGQTLGMTNYVDVENLNQSTLFNNIVSTTISQETFRQRLDQLALDKSISQDIDQTIIDLLKKIDIEQEIWRGKSYFCLDIDVTPFENENCKKEGVGCTYKKVNGYAPIMAYIGNNAIAFELRDGTQHCQKDALSFLRRCLYILDQIGIKREEILLRVDSGHDATDFINLCLTLDIRFIICRNFRSAKKNTIKYITNNSLSKESTKENNYILDIHSHVEKRCRKIDGKIYDYNCVYYLKNFYLPAEAPLLEMTENFKSSEVQYGKLDNSDLQAFWTNIDTFDSAVKTAENFKSITEDCVAIYHAHATSEQYHSEVKSDMKMELLPSGKFATNQLYLQLSAISFNILRIIGQEAMKSSQKTFQHHNTVETKRLRLKTVIKIFCTMSCKVIKHAGKIIVKLGSQCYGEILLTIFKRLLA